MKRILLILFTALFFAPRESRASSDPSPYIESFSASIMDEQFETCLEILEDWNEKQPWYAATILGLKSTIYLCLGEIDKSSILMRQSLSHLQEEGAPAEMLALIENIYASLTSFENNLLCSNVRHFDPRVLLCKENKDAEQDKCEQPTGLKIRYWFGGGLMLVGLLITPISPKMGIGFITSGFEMTFQAGMEAMDNKSNWEKEARAKRKMEKELEAKQIGIETPYKRDIFTPNFLII